MNSTGKNKRAVIAIVACDEGRVIGLDNQIPWHIPEDMKRFAALTTGHNVLMGSKTYFSLPERFRPLPKRKNFVVTRNSVSLQEQSSITVLNDPLSFISDFKAGKGEFASDLLWIIGGEQIYKLTYPLWDRLELTSVVGRNKGDAYFPEFEQDFKLLKDEDFSTYSFKSYVRIK